MIYKGGVGASRNLSLNLDKMSLKKTSWNYLVNLFISLQVNKSKFTASVWCGEILLITLQCNFNRY